MSGLEFVREDIAASPLTFRRQSFSRTDALWFCRGRCELGSQAFEYSLAFSLQFRGVRPAAKIRSVIDCPHSFSQDATLKEPVFSLNVRQRKPKHTFLFRADYLLESVD
jgi:hypothetical protein